MATDTCLWILLFHARGAARLRDGALPCYKRDWHLEYSPGALRLDSRPQHDAVKRRLLRSNLSWQNSRKAISR